MAAATFLTWADFKTHTSVTLPRYYIVRGDGKVTRAMGVNATSGVTHFYDVPEDEDLIPTGLGMDIWFTGSAHVQGFTA